MRLKSLAACFAFGVATLVLPVMHQGVAWANCSQCHNGPPAAAATGAVVAGNVWLTQLWLSLFAS